MLLLFDIDGTLLSGATEAHRAALDEALREVHGVDAAIGRRGDLFPAGRTGGLSGAARTGGLSGAGRTGGLSGAGRTDGVSPAGRTDGLSGAGRTGGLSGAGRTDGVSPAGRTDGEIARLILLGAGISAARIDERAEAVRHECCRAYARLCPADLSHTVLPGVPRLLDWLSDRQDVRLGLLTGNYEPVARLKLARAGIGSYFPPGQGAFGSDAEDRAALPAIARRRAGARADEPGAGGRGAGARGAGARGTPYPRERTVVIGDTPRDIACARADQVRCLAVATGPFSEAELGDADGVAADASGIRALLERELS